MNININIEEAVINYLQKKKNDSFTVNIKTSGGGCCPTFEIAEIELGKPKDINIYEIYQSNGITIFMSKKAIIISTLSFSLQKNILTNSIIVSGLSLKRR